MATSPLVSSSRALACFCFLASRCLDKLKRTSRRSLPVCRAAFEGATDRDFGYLKKAAIGSCASTGHRQAVKRSELVEADLLDLASLERVFAGRRFDAVIPFCTRSLVSRQRSRTRTTPQRYRYA